MCPYSTTDTSWSRSLSLASFLLCLMFHLPPRILSSASDIPHASIFCHKYSWIVSTSDTSWSRNLSLASVETCDQLTQGISSSLISPDIDFKISRHKIKFSSSATYCYSSSSQRIIFFIIFIFIIILIIINRHFVVQWWLGWSWPRQEFQQPLAPMLLCMDAMGDFNVSSSLSGLLARNFIAIVVAIVIAKTYLHHQVF